MKNTFKVILVFFLSISLSYIIHAEKVHIYDPNGGGKTIKSLASGCMPAKGVTELNINNVKCRINTGGDMWWDLDGNAKYFIPANTKKTSMFSGSLWIGGVDINGQLKVAALRYRQVGNDYWPGPLTVDGTAAVDPQTCVKYDKHFVIYRKDVDDFLAWKSDPSRYPDYSMPEYFKTYPAHPYADVPLSELMSHYLAPFKDFDGDGEYDPTKGDYPYYDISNELCKTQIPTAEGNGILVDQVLKGDQTVWWVFNDKGNVHSESKGQPIGFEIRAQAFAFATNDEINNMTFYSYEIINRSTYELTGTYFSQWVDTDLGYANDDYVGCDVLRGLGFCYNGKEIDGAGQPNSYGVQPPAVGVDFFQGPYMDPDLIDNPKYNPSTHENCNEAVNGVNFGDGIVDNERFGMRRFVYHNNGGPDWQSDPDIAIDYYNLLRGIWKDGTKMTYGGNGHGGSIPADFMFPGTSDPCNWGTNGIVPSPLEWSERTAGNPPADRRFMHSAGPFVLKSGAVNYITVGIPWARASSGGAWASVELLKQADDKCQILFNNCFKVIDGPTAPDLTIQELDKELIIYITNRKGSNNYNTKPEDYQEFDPSIVTPDTLRKFGFVYDSTYKFQGYQIYQLKNANITGNDLSDPDKARLVFQCDIKDSIVDIINFETNANTGMLSSVKKVDGAKNAGIVHSFRVLTDKFATGTSNRIVNHKQYYFMAVAYGYNEYLHYSQDPNDNYTFRKIVNGDTATLVVSALYGQKKPYLSGRKNLVVNTGIPHNPIVENSGTIINSFYGYGPKITRLDGQGNGGQYLELTQASIDKIMAITQPPYKIDNPEYENMYGPINVKVIDPLGVKPGNFIVKFKNPIYKQSGGGSGFDANDTTRIIDADWDLINSDNGNVIISSDRSIKVANEQILLDLGLSITIGQPLYPGLDSNTVNNGFLGAQIIYADSTKPWLDGVGDVDYDSPSNWIRDGAASAGVDPNGYYGSMIPSISYNPGGATWSAYKLSSSDAYGPAYGTYLSLSRMEYLQSVNLVFTNDKSKWTRCPVMEICEDPQLSEGNQGKFRIRKGSSVDKEGNPDGTGTGMGWFPGYAINIETGERLNVFFAENSWLIGENGRDMKFNPTSNFMTNPPTNQVLFGGQHYVYVVGHFGDGPDDCPSYDEGAWLKDRLSSTNTQVYRHAFRSIMWVGLPMQNKNFTWMNCDATIKFRVERLYKKYMFGNTLKDSPTTPQNNYAPMYSFSTNDLQTIYNDNTTAKNALDLINVVPNPYYAYSKYEENQLDNRIKFVNLPKKCTISIYTVNGTLIRKLTKDSEVTYFDWDMKNTEKIPVAGGVYLIHVDAPGIGEKVIKWFGIMRPIDLNAF